MTRHAQPREVAELKGATRHDPQRYRAKPPEVEHPLGEAPDHLTEGAKSCWFELAEYAPVGVLKGADRLMLEVTCELLSDFRERPRKFPAAKIGHLIGCLARLGMSPADRQKLGSVPEKPAGEFDDY